jgi:hypothetical protein
MHYLKGLEIVGVDAFKNSIEFMEMLQVLRILRGVWPVLLIRRPTAILLWFDRQHPIRGGWKDGRTSSDGCDRRPENIGA